MFTLPSKVTSTFELTSKCLSQFSFSPIAVPFIHVVHIGRFFWRSWSSLHFRSAKPELYLPGVILNEFVGSVRCIRIAMRVIVISRILLEIFDDLVHLSRTIRDITKIVDESNGPNSYVDVTDASLGWRSEEGKTPPQTFLPKDISQHMIRVKLLVERTKELGCLLWSLTGCLCDLAESVWVQGEDEGVADLFIECQRLTEVSGGLMGLSRAILFHEHQLDSTLQFIGFKVTAADLAHKVDCVIHHQFQDILSLSFPKCKDGLQGAQLAASTLF